MQWRTNVLVVANVTATSHELVSALTTRAERESVVFTLIVPAAPLAGGRAAAQSQLTEALALLRDRGLEVDGRVGASDPLIAVSDEWDPSRYDEIVVCTLPIRFSKWLHAGLPERIVHLTDARVTHVVAPTPRPPAQTTPVPAHDKRDPMGPLSVLSWGGHKQR